MYIKFFVILNRNINMYRNMKMNTFKFSVNSDKKLSNHSKCRLNQIKGMLLKKFNFIPYVIDIFKLEAA